ncbi:MAG: hypothetical protein HY980_03030 [Candidatus Magasanikbacteria bacterium]|nr:hypothetical protein [Candidatus Magasanikbacteria bacterium]
MFLSLGWLGWRFASEHRVQAPVKGGRYVEAVVGSPKFVNPIFASTNDVDMDIAHLVFSGLMRYDAKHRLVPDLAVNYDLSTDKKIYTFELRHDIVWHDGEPFTARDVRFTIEAIQNAAVNSPLFVSFQGIQVSVVDDYVVRFVLPEPFNQFLSVMTAGILPEHVWFDVPPEQMRFSNLNLQSIGTGPFMFKKLAKDDTGYIYSYELERFDRYFRQPPFLDEFVFQFYPEYEGSAGALEVFRGQKVDGLNFVPHALRDKVMRKHVVLHTPQLPQYTALFFNQDNQPILKDKNARLALAKAVDKEKILQQALKGEGSVIGGPILPGFIGYDADAGEVAHSMEEAGKLLDEKWARVSFEDYRQKRKDELWKIWEDSQKAASSTPDETTTSTPDETAKQKAETDINSQLDNELSTPQTFYRKDKDGKILELNLVTVKNEEYRKAAEIIAGLWQEVGVKVNMKFYEAKEFSREVLKPRNYDILLYGEIIGDDPDPFPFWHSSQVDYPGLNLSRYVDRNADALIEKARATANEDERAGLYKKFQELLAAELPAVFLYMPTYTYATTDRVNGLGVERISRPADRFADVTGWYVKTSGRWQW